MASERSQNLQESFLNALRREKIPVTISLQNRSFLPIPWLNVRETLPHELATYEVMRRVIAIKPRSSMDIDYELSGNRRGYHPVG